MTERGCYWCKKRKGLMCSEKNTYGTNNPISNMCLSAGRKLTLESLRIQLYTTSLCIGNSCPSFVHNKIITPEKVEFT